MLKKRVIPTLLFKDNVLVKGKNFLSDRPVGSAIESIQIYDFREVDELIFYDILATKKDQCPDYNLISEISKECFVPLIIGGGIDNLKIIEKLLRVGADKVSINTAASLNPNFLKLASKEFGSQCIVASIVAKKIASNNWEAYTGNGRDPSGLSVTVWAKEVENQGAGEIMVTSIDSDGTKKGFDIELNKTIVSQSGIPVIASGGGGTSEHIVDLIMNSKVDAVALASMLHYDISDIKNIKSSMSKQHIEVRL